MLVVGAGPVGLTAALALRARGLSVTVLEADPADRVRPGSRALFVHRESLSTMEAISPGLGFAVARYGVVWRTRRTLHRGRHVYSQSYPPHDPAVLPPFTSLRQVDTERFLLEACQSAGVEFRWGTAVATVEYSAGGVTVVARDGRRFTAGYVVAADGARSAVRRAVGIELSGTRSEGSHVVVDIAALDGEQPTERTFHYEHPAVGNRTVRQVDTERFLLEACQSAGVEFRWGTAVATVEYSAGGVTVVARDGRRFTAGYVVAADGARSAVRRAVGIELSGTRSEGSHVVVDIAALDGEQPTERTFHYEHPAVGNRTVLQVPFAGGFQVDLQCRDDDPPDAFGSAEAVRRWLPQVVGAEYTERVLWVSTYHFLQKVADAFADPRRRVLLVGEAAHLFPPFGARGMNSGIADAASAAAAIAAALARPRNAAARVDAFAAKRREAALFNSAAAGEALAHLRPRPVMRVRQRLAARLAPAVAQCGSWLEHAPYGPRRNPRAVSGRRY